MIRKSGSSVGIVVHWAIVTVLALSAFAFLIAGAVSYRKWLHIEFRRNVSGLSFSRGWFSHYWHESVTHEVQLPDKRIELPGVFSYVRTYRYDHDPPPKDGTVHFLGIDTVDPGGRWVMVPTWGVSVVLALYPAFAFRRLFHTYRRSRRRDKGLCVCCCYNLEGNVSGTCPECGERI